MPALPRRLGVPVVLIAGLLLGFAPVPSDAAPDRPGYRPGRDRSAAAGRGSLHQTRSTPAKRAPAIAKNTGKPEPTEAAAVKPVAKERSAAWTSGEGERACFRGRRKLWQGDQGWVVKKVSVCP